MTHSRSGLLGSGLALIGLGVATYLAATRLAGELPTCGPLRGCETVALSEYSEIAGIPVAFLGVGFSAVLFGLQVLWWRTGDRRALIAAYGLGLFGILFAAYLTYLELFVIHAVCVWCVAYAVAILAGWVVAATALRGSQPRSR